MVAGYKKRDWTDDELQVLRNEYSDTISIEIATKVGHSLSSVYRMARKLGLKKSEAFFLDIEKSGRLGTNTGKAHRFPKGHVPFNKGKKMPNEVYQRCAPTMFKKGIIPPNTYPDWHEVLCKEKSGKKYWKIKLPNNKKLQFKHVWLWEKSYGQVPKGYNVVFKDGNQMNCVIENLECISNAELMQRNTINRFPTELKSTIRLVNKLKRVIHAKEQN